MEGDREKEEECQICYNPIQFYSIAPCDHPIFCSNCSLRLRILKKDLRCPLCQTESTAVIFSKTKHPYSSFKLLQLKNDTKLGIYFDSKSTYQDSISILSYHCPVADCPSRNLGGFAHLTTHLTKKHKLLTCELCIEHKHLFPSEIETFTTKAALARHKSKGDEVFKGHTFCQHCNEYFYDKDALYSHVRSRHEVCFLCAREGHPEQIYDNYSTLEIHFNNDHYACREPSCLEKKFVAFGSDIDLQGHIAREHSNSKGKSKGRAINLDFTYATSSPSSSRGGRIRGQDSEVSQNHASSSRRFNSQLTVEPEFNPQIKSQVRSNTPAVNNFANSFPSLHTAIPTQEVLLTPAQADVFASAGPDFILLLQKLIGKELNSLGQLKISFHAFKSGTIPSEKLLTDFLSLIDSGNPAKKKSTDLMTESQSVWHRMAELLPEEASDAQVQRALDKKSRKKGLSLEEFEALRRGEPKRSSLLRVWNDYKVKVQQSESVSSLALMKKSSWAAIDPDPKLKKNPSAGVLKVVSMKGKSIVGSSSGGMTIPTPAIEKLNNSTEVSSMALLSVESSQTPKTTFVPTSEVVISSNSAPLNRSQASFPALPSAKKSERISLAKKPNRNQNLTAWTNSSSASAEEGSVEESSNQAKKGKKKKVLMKFG